MGHLSMEQQKARRLFIRTPGPLDRAQDRELWWVPRKELSLATSCDFRLGKDDTNLERSETSGLSRGHVDACLGPYLVRALASRVSISYLLRVSPDLCRRLRGRTGLRRWFNTLLHICTATTPDSEKRPCVNPSR